MAIEQFDRQSDELKGGKVLQGHQEMVVVKGDLVLKRSRADVMTAACFFAQMY
jgi:hypothetical protein